MQRIREMSAGYFPISLFPYLLGDLFGRVGFGGFSFVDATLKLLDRVGGSNGVSVGEHDEAVSAAHGNAVGYLGNADNGLVGDASGVEVVFGEADRGE